MSSKFNAALAVPPQGFCQLPDLVPGGQVADDRVADPAGEREGARDAAKG